MRRDSIESKKQKQEKKRKKIIKKGPCIHNARRNNLEKRGKRQHGSDTGLWRLLIRLVMNGHLIKATQRDHACVYAHSFVTCWHMLESSQ